MDTRCLFRRGSRRAHLDKSLRALFVRSAIRQTMPRLRRGTKQPAARAAVRQRKQREKQGGMERKG